MKIDLINAYKSSSHQRDELDEDEEDIHNRNFDYHRRRFRDEVEKPENIEKYTY